MTTGFVTTSFPRYPGDFAGCFVEDAARECVAAGETVEVISAGAPAPQSLVEGIRVWRIASPDARVTEPLFFGAGAPEVLEGRGITPWVQGALFWVALCERLRDRAPGWKRIVAHWLVPSALAARAIAPRLPLTAYAHSGDVALLERLPGGAAIARKLARETDDLIFVSADLRRRFARLTGRLVGRVARLSGATLPKAPSGGRRLPSLIGPSPSSRPAIVVLSAGRLVPIKGFDVLLRAVAAAADGRGVPGNHWMTVVILGEGPERKRLQDLAGRLGIDLRLPGCVPRPAVRQWMAQATIYVQPSRRLQNGRSEGLPLATLEAEHAGLPLIVSDTGGLGELETPARFPSDDAPALATLLARFAPQAACSGIPGGLPPEVVQPAPGV